MDSKERLSNFELLRIISMLMIVACHLVTHGIQQRGLDEPYKVYFTMTMQNRVLSALFPPGGDIGVAIFFMLTGYFQVKKNQPHLKKLILQCCYYGWFTMIVFLVSKALGYLSELDISAIMQLLINAVAPLTNGVWWFVTAYILVMIASPMINRFVEKLNRGGIVIVMLVFWIILMVIPGVFGSNYSNLYRGFFLYLIGAVMRLQPSYTCKKRSRRWLFIVFAVLLWIAVSWICFAVLEFDLLHPGVLNLIAYTVLSPCCAFFIFRVFEAYQIRYISIINKIAATTFGIYLIHDSFVGRELFWKDIFKIDTIIYNTTLFPVYAVIIAVMVFAICSAIDYLRLRFVEPFAMKKYEQIKAQLYAERATEI